MAFHWYLEAWHQGVLRVALENGWEVTPLNVDTVGGLNPGDFDGAVGMFPGNRSHPVNVFVGKMTAPVVELSLAHPENKDRGRCPENCALIAEKVAKFLAARPVRSLVFVAHSRWWNHDRRAAAFESALAGDKRPRKFFFLTETEAPVERTLGEAFLRLPRPVGVFASVDDSAKRVVDAALQAGLSVPDDVLVLGFGNRELVSKWTPIPIGTVAIDNEAWAAAASRLLAGMIDGRFAPGTVVEFPPGEIIERRSTGLLPEAESLCARALVLLGNTLSEPLSAAELAAALKVSHSTLERAFDREFGCSVARKSLLLRIDHAKRLLAAGVKTEAVAEDSGFRSYSAFIAAFKRLSGVTPGVYAAEGGDARRAG